jgi:two-component system chemotaxis response regulator CheY
MTARVLVVDDSAFMRSRIKRLLNEHGLDVAGEARDGNEAAALYATLKPDAVTMDLTMRGADGLTGSRTILAKDPSAKIVLFSIVEDPEVVSEALACGIRAYVHKSRPEELADRLCDLVS